MVRLGGIGGRFVQGGCGWRVGTASCFWRQVNSSASISPYANQQTPLPRKTTTQHTIHVAHTTPRNVTRSEEIESNGRVRRCFWWWRHGLQVHMSQALSAGFPSRGPELPHDKHGGGTCHNNKIRWIQRPSLPHFGSTRRREVPAHTQSKCQS